MKIFPAIDLKENKCVRLIRGKDSTSVIFNEDPVKQAKYFEQNPGGTATPLGSVMHDKSDEDNWQFLVAIIMF